MAKSERLEAIEERIQAYWQRFPEDQDPELHQAYVDIADLLYYMEGAERDLDKVKAQSDERAARAWDKGYNTGHHDGVWHDRYFQPQRGEKSRRNPYRFEDNGQSCGCHGGGKE